jgi:ABC-type transport system substrate-binding protein
MRAIAIVLALWLVPFLSTAAIAAPEGKIIIAQGVDPTTLDPQWHEETPAYNVLLNIYDTLLFRDKDLKIIPWLAESWRLLNPTTWEFKIRKGVRFHNGEEVDAPIDEAQTAVDPKRRLELYANAQRIMLDDGAVLPLYQQMDIYGVSKRVGFQALSSEQLVGAWMSLRNGKGGQEDDGLELVERLLVEH